MEVILGDNPFFGVNHISQNKAQKYYSRADKYANAAGVISEAVKAGVKTLMVSTHVDLPELLSEYKSQECKYIDLAIVVPYAQKLNTVVGEKGLVGLTSTAFKPSDILGLVSDSYDFFIKKKIPKNMTRFFLEQEYALANDFPIKYVCIQNVLTDLLLSFKSHTLIEDFIDALHIPGSSDLVFITQNPIVLDQYLPKKFISCFTYNKCGFMVNPNLVDVREYVASTDRKLWAMGVFASGQLSKRDIFDDEYLKYFNAVLYATSNKERVKDAVSSFMSVSE